MPFRNEINKGNCINDKRTKKKSKDTIPASEETAALISSCEMCLVRDKSKIRPLLEESCLTNVRTNKIKGNNTNTTTEGHDYIFWENPTHIGNYIMRT